MQQPSHRSLFVYAEERERERERGGGRWRERERGGGGGGGRERDVWCKYVTAVMKAPAFDTRVSERIKTSASCCH